VARVESSRTGLCRQAECSAPGRRACEFREKTCAHEQAAQRQNTNNRWCGLTQAVSTYSICGLWAQMAAIAGAVMQSRPESAMLVRLWQCFAIADAVSSVSCRRLRVW
jgi:hypothetical protein